jgi:ADP-ribose pyrophosphatase
METWIDDERAYRGKIVNLRVGRVRMDDGSIATREVVEHPGGVAIVPVLGDSILLIRQYRIAVGKDILEIPAGKLEGPEDTEQRGRAELEEECGYLAGRMVRLGTMYASVGYTSEEIHLYAALDLKEVGQKLEVDERIDVVPVSFEEIKRLIATNELKDSKTIVAVEALFRYLDSKK